MTNHAYLVCMQVEILGIRVCHFYLELFSTCTVCTMFILVKLLPKNIVFFVNIADNDHNVRKVCLLALYSRVVLYRRKYTILHS